MGTIRWDCYRYYTGQLAPRSAPGRGPAAPALAARDWRLQHFNDFVVASCIDVAEALAWAEHALGEACGYINAFPGCDAPRLLDLVRAVAEGLAGSDFAWQHRFDLPDRHVLVLAVVGHWDTRWHTVWPPSASERSFRPGNGADTPPGTGATAPRNRVRRPRFRPTTE